MKTALLSLMLACANKAPTATKTDTPRVVPTEESVHHTGPQKTTGITGVEVLGQIDLQTEFEGFEKQIVMRVRRLSIAENGVVAAHEHQSRPGVAFMLDGEMTEFRDGEKFTRGKGDLSFERTGVTHWWENLSGAPASALVVDILHPKEPTSIAAYRTKESPKDATKENTGLSIVKKEELSLSGEHPALAGKNLRVRVIDVAPEGTVGLHLHKARPGFAYVLDGTLTEYRNDQVEPHRHEAGSIAIERNGVEHWWQNASQTPARVLVVDVSSTP